MRSRTKIPPAEELQALAQCYELSLVEGEKLNWESAFGRIAPNHIEIGTGNGIFLVDEAARHPEINFLGIERAAEFYWKMVKRIDRIGLRNVRTTHADARQVLEHVPAHSVARIYCYFSDPWPKRRHAKNRVVSDALLPSLERVLAPAGEFWFKTDVDWYFNSAIAIFSARPDWTILERRQFPDNAPEAAAEIDAIGSTGEVVTNFERKAREAGRAVWGYKVRYG